MTRSPDEQTADLERVDALRRGDEQAFTALFDEVQPGLRRIVRHYVDNPAVAEEVLQETWLGVIRGIFGFEGRSSLRTWIFRILVNRAKARATREKRVVPFADAGANDRDEPEADDAPAHALPDVRSSPERALLDQELEREIATAIDVLPSNLRLVLTLRDVEGWSSADVCNVLGLRETNQRVLLHRARQRVRAQLQPYLKGTR